MTPDRINGAHTLPPGSGAGRLNGGRLPGHPPGLPAGDTRGTSVPVRSEGQRVVGQVGDDAIGALRWGMRQYVWLLALCVLLVVVVVPFYLATRPSENRATALVVAKRLDMDLPALPRYGEAVFDNGEVARVIAARFGDVGDLEDVVPQRVALVAEQDSIVFQVVGIDPSPQVAADMANLAAESFVAQLNAPGEGVGLFSLQSRALPPPEAEEQLPPLPALVPIALAAGLLLGLTAVAAVLVIRRPVLDGGSATDATGVPILGTITLPRARDNDYPGLSEISGMVPVCRRLLALDVHTIVLVGPVGAERGRRQLVVAMSYVLGRVRNVRLVVDSAAAAAADAYGGHETREPAKPSPTPRPIRDLTLMDGTQPLDPVQLTGGTLTVLVVPRGTSTSSLRAAVTEHLGGTDAGWLMMLDERPPRRKARRTAMSRDTPEPRDTQMYESDLTETNLDPSSIGRSRQ